MAAFYAELRKCIIGWQPHSKQRKTLLRLRFTSDHSKLCRIDCHHQRLSGIGVGSNGGFDVKEWFYETLKRVHCPWHVKPKKK
jgi:hypothetical protein